MRAITKGAEPPSLTAHRKTAHCDYDNYPDKDALRHALLNEQRGLCCYCMSRIHNGPTTMKIEHWHCQDCYGGEQLDYKNMLAACMGGQGQPPRLQHCDTRKGNADLLWNPANPLHRIETRIRYGPYGEIRSDDTRFDTQLDDVLNLNLPFFKSNRRALLDALLEWWKREKARLQGPIPRQRLEQERDKRVQGTGKLAPFCQVAVWWLELKLSRMAT